MVIFATLNNRSERFKMKRDYIPESNGGFFTWQENFLKVAAAKAGGWSIPGGEVTALQTLQTDFVPKFKKANKVADVRASDRTARNDSRNKYEKALRRFVRI